MSSTWTHSQLLKSDRKLTFFTAPRETFLPPSSAAFSYYKFLSFIYSFIHFINLVARDGSQGLLRLDLLQLKWACESWASETKRNGLNLLANDSWRPIFDVLESLLRPPGTLFLVAKLSLLRRPGISSESVFSAAQESSNNNNNNNTQDDIYSAVYTALAICESSLWIIWTTVGSAPSVMSQSRKELQTPQR